MSANPPIPVETEPDNTKRAGLVLISLAAFVVLVFAARSIAEIIAPIFLGLNLMIVAHPIHRALVKAKIPSPAAAVVTLLTVLVVVFAFLLSTIWSLSELVRIIPDYAPQFDALLRDGLGWLDSVVGISADAIASEVSKGLTAANVLNLLTPLFNNLAAIMSLLATLLMAVFFLAMDSTDFTRRLSLASRVEPRFTEAMHTFAHGVRRYWVVATVFGLIVAVLDVVALTILGVPLALVWGVLSFLTNYIPNIGFVLGLIPPALVALLEIGPTAALWVVIAYVVLNFVIQAIIQPKVAGESVGVTPFISFFSLLFWYFVLGALGALLALPATLLVRALLVDGNPKAQWINLLISSDRRVQKASLRDAVLRRRAARQEAAAKAAAD
ncbi:AI-2E family transporter [Micrococcoides hystricis]|uniref:AI-2E family transporter n=1 Tax=Micrococcoides hystricis TaxID=1572761 RepID=A0ABV6PCL0_9MICC